VPAGEARSAERSDDDARALFGAGGFRFPRAGTRPGGGTAGAGGQTFDLGDIFVTFARKTG